MHKFMTKFKSIKLNYSNIAGNVRERDKQVYMKMCTSFEGKEKIESIDQNSGQLTTSSHQIGSLKYRNQN